MTTSIRCFLLSPSRFFSIAAVAAFVAAYIAYALWIFGTQPAIPDHAVIIAGLITYVGLSVIALSVTWRVVRRLLVLFGQMNRPRKPDGGADA